MNNLITLPLLFVGYTALSYVFSRFIFKNNISFLGNIINGLIGLLIFVISIYISEFL